MDWLLGQFSTDRYNTQESVGGYFGICRAAQEVQSCLSCAKIAFAFFMRPALTPAQ
jgi:hypothetical protein